MPVSEREKLHGIVSRAHAAGYWVRFWATPVIARSRQFLPANDRAEQHTA